MTRKKSRYNPVPGQYPDAINLYRFIRLVLGNKISDLQIARGWKMHEKNFHEMKLGKYPVPRIKD